MTPPTPVVYIVDDDPTVCDALTWLVESINLKCQAFATAQEFLKSYKPGQPGCLIADVRMPEMSGLDLQAEMAERDIDLPAIIISGHGDVATAVQAMKGGAVDFIQKPFNDQQLLNLVQKLIRQSVDNEKLREKQDDVRQRLTKLTLRERQVLDRMIAGDPNKRIAASIGRSEKTIAFHRGRVMEKMNAKSLASLVTMVIEAGKSK
jgi:two-component system, LuxR family, response regulator FixJ